MLSTKELTDLYCRYGFAPGPCFDEYLVFYSQSGYFQNAEIVIIDKSFDIRNLDKEEYETLGYSVRVRTPENIFSVHEELFRGFFNIEASNKKLELEYYNFCKQQNDKLMSNDYHYISGDFIESGVLKGNSDIIQRIQNIFDMDDRQLIILEAAAGYGKTCTSFEVIKSLIENSPTKIPLLAELSKNRTASIFRYVLLSEIDQKFPALSSDLVTYEIYCGRVLLIIDGFDELLSKRYLTLQEKERNTSKDVQTMLDTIAQLFPKGSKTKVLLTTRKSSIFVGEDFDNWVEAHLSECNITRLQLSEPSLRNWLGPEKISILEQNHIDLNNILNPVLLTILRNESSENFAQKYTSNDQIINQYLNLLLKREQTRQALPLNVEEQLKIMSSLAAQMVQYDISSEDIEFIKSILSDIIAPNFEEYQQRYEYLPNCAETKPSESEFLNKLSHHALLDRLSSQSNQIGFINDFIFGQMIAQAAIEQYLPPSELSGKYLDIAITAYSANNLENRKKLYETIAPTLSKETAQRRLNASLYLLNVIDGQYNGEYFDGISFGKNLNITDLLLFQNCIFSDCVFRYCRINTDSFKTCQFYNCSFFKNEIIPGETYDSELIFLSCIGHETFATLAHRNYVEVQGTQNYEQTVLEQFWKPGYETAEPRRAYQTLLKGVGTSERPLVTKAIDSLVKKNILIKYLHSFVLNFEKMNEIRTIIHR